MSAAVTVLIQGASAPACIPHLERIGSQARLRAVPADAALAEHLPGIDILLGWDFRADALRAAWHAADRLRWVHWSGAGVDTVLFPELARSDVVLTNAAGIFDRAIAEYVLGLVLAFAKRLPETVRAQTNREWNHRLSERIDGRRALVVGIGSIGRCIARLLKAAGMRLEGVGRRARAGDPDFERIYAAGDLETAITRADYMVVATPLTGDTRGLIGRSAIAAMAPHARLINVGRGPVVDQAALAEALADGRIAGAALDVFAAEPLPPSDPLWSLPNVVISPHMSGDFVGFDQDLGWLFVENFRRFQSGLPLLNRIDKAQGY